MENKIKKSIQKWEENYSEFMKESTCTEPSPSYLERSPPRTKQTLEHEEVTVGCNVCRFLMEIGGHHT